MGSWDPNDIIGPEGVGALGYVAARVPLEYTILFENDPELAQVPAFSVTLTQQLDADFDLSVLEFVSFGFGDHVFEIPAGLAAYHTRLLVPQANRTLLLDVFAGVDFATRVLLVQLKNLDPATGLPPEDVDAGFLPPNINNGTAGQGFFVYRVAAATAPTQPANSAARMNASADALPRTLEAQVSIVFDNNAPILTPRISNAIDDNAPEVGSVTMVYVANASLVLAILRNVSDVGSGIDLQQLSLPTPRGSRALAAPGDQPIQIPLELWSQSRPEEALLRVSDAVGNTIELALCSSMNADCVLDMTTTMSASSSTAATTALTVTPGNLTTAGPLSTLRTTDTSVTPHFNATSLASTDTTEMATVTSQQTSEGTVAVNVTTSSSLTSATKNSSTVTTESPSNGMETTEIPTLTPQQTSEATLAVTVTASSSLTPMTTNSSIVTTASAENSTILTTTSQQTSEIQTTKTAPQQNYGLLEVELVWKGRANLSVEGKMALGAAVADAVALTLALPTDALKVLDAVVSFSLPTEEGGNSSVVVRLRYNTTIQVVAGWLVEAGPSATNSTQTLPLRVRFDNRTLMGTVKLGEEDANEFSGDGAAGEEILIVIVPCSVALLLLVAIVVLLRSRRVGHNQIANLSTVDLEQNTTQEFDVQAMLALNRGVPVDDEKTTSVTKV